LQQGTYKRLVRVNKFPTWDNENSTKVQQKVAQVSQQFAPICATVSAFTTAIATMRVWGANGKNFFLGAAIHAGLRVWHKIARLPGKWQELFLGNSCIFFIGA